MSEIPKEAREAAEHIAKRIADATPKPLHLPNTKGMIADLIEMAAPIIARAYAPKEAALANVTDELMRLRRQLSHYESVLCYETPLAIPAGVSGQQAIPSVDPQKLSAVMAALKLADELAAAWLADHSIRNDQIAIARRYQEARKQ